MNSKARSNAGAFLWSLVAAVVVTGAVHALAMNLPDWYSARASREASSMERLAGRFSEAWMANAFLWAALVAAASFLIVLPLLLWRASASARKATAAATTASSPPDSGAG